MQELLSGWAKLLASSELPDALDKGEDAVIHLLGDVLDSWLQTTLPPYATAVQICAAAQDAGVVDCDRERIRVRDTLLTELLELTGAIELIRAAIKAWHVIPGPVRDAARQVFETAATLGDLYNDPSLGNFYRAMGASIDYSQLSYASMYRAFLDDPSLGKISEWVGRVTGVEVGLITDVLSAFDYAADQIDTAARSVVTALGGSAAGDIYDAAHDLVTDPVGTARDAVTHPVETVTSVVETGADAIESVVDTAEDLVTDPVGTVTGWL